MLSEDSREEQINRHGRRRRAKRLLRFVPRKAMLHKYPVIGRFAEFARRRAYLWSFRSQHLRPSFYAGSILALLPVMGVQLPAALALSLVLRGNFMVMGGLQFITNPFTAAPIYYATHQLGAKVIDVSGIGRSIEVIELTATHPTDARSAVPQPPQLEAARVTPPDGEPVHWTRRVGNAINALVLGGVISGTLLGAALDVLWRIAHRSPQQRRCRGAGVL
jgi:uncharacterized protein (DUF2062 family)